MSTPVVVLAGFLGAGKTTVLNQLLRSATDVRLGVVVNDFGAVGIDALLVAGWADSAVSLENGCLCCSTDDGSVDELLARLTAPRRGPGLDAVVIEASGVADPAAMVRRVLTSSVPGVSYGGLVVVVDAVEFAAARRRHPELDDHVAMADVVLLTKTDLVGPEEAARTAAACRELNAWAPVVPAARGQLDARLLFEPRPPRQRQLALGEVVAGHPDGPDGPDGHGTHLHALYDTLTFRSEDPLDPRRFVEFFQRRPSGVFRVKGFVRFAVQGFPQRYLLHTVGAAVRFERGPWPRGAPRVTELVLVGAGLDAEGLRTALRACVHEGPPLTDEMAMMGVLRDTEGA
ncbi:CobW family GTP-binding protein [Kineococcus radiotolerans]|uniref:Cobalamin synthesis protein P47K n=1 Tax=Kineococcus radiotolerans (strain ATCC BAA-149 / DSM 14245 / SRS30216) TaxID=266940 RepID=A6WEZ8_KINRD|nr:GTP-binding protein [Kineococcus radiotolerans]ABS05387.1 cobalamin synthesis protein P47K [Kineococcus radiotolerans SRS30216 = ATCC BAA-149]